MGLKAKPQLLITGVILEWPVHSKVKKRWGHLGSSPCRDSQVRILALFSQTLSGCRKSQKTKTQSNTLNSTKQKSCKQAVVNKFHEIVLKVPNNTNSKAIQVSGTQSRHSPEVTLLIALKDGLLVVGALDQLPVQVKHHATPEMENYTPLNFRHLNIIQLLVASKASEPCLQIRQQPSVIQFMARLGRDHKCFNPN